jgi:hypothetical protein
LQVSIQARQVVKLVALQQKWNSKRQKWENMYKLKFVTKGYLKEPKGLSFFRTYEIVHDHSFEIFDFSSAFLLHLS